MTYAIVETSGRQIRVEPGRFYDVDRLALQPGDTINLDLVLYTSHEDDIQVGQPFIKEAVVSGTVMSHLRGRKIIVYKMQPKKKTRKKRGHRQELTRIMIDSISIGDTVLASSEAASSEAASSEVATEPVAVEAAVEAAAATVDA
ncbi:MAG: 50S ribosomal protein L21 [Leptolyngbya sp. RL_3_1]|nr:50S ribosomal protein L21 [Leptolyngbya sp. RL_3_1]